ncbi:hypothetical protein BKA67DRAFT_8834 [Truncatella angustata]|uniref:Uncharacterized protein n=1 Tax=Truncatella angustata TaxID=152316 RepID=A0A9P8UWH5_9PEZI|nr:uncharacterized protein BKA67DRAFT_8834 [Truncatella angustata]KAH6659249.1 hypothetical protein BKA67DRAFT_8834 [Truncatella angustata]
MDVSTDVMTTSPLNETPGHGHHEKPVDQYARDNGLTIDCIIDPLYLISSLSLVCDHSGSLHDDGSLRPFQLSCPLSLHERPSIPKASVELLTHVKHRDDIRTVTDATLTELNESPCARKLELPLLRSDAEVDSINLQQEINTRTAINIQADLPPFEPLDVSQDEALGFPQSAHIYHDEVENLLRRERTAIYKDGIEYLKRAVQDT